VNGFKYKFGVKNPIEKWRQGLIKRTGYLDRNNEVQFSLHGAGCTVEFANGEIVTFDFTEDEKINIDLFKFKIFVLSYLSNNETEIDEYFESITLTKKNDMWEVEKK
jgi:hypothetical protein